MLRRILSDSRRQPFTYSPVGATRSEELPSGFPHNRHQVRLGYGRDTFERARTAIAGWRMYDLDWTRLCWRDVPPAEQMVVGVLVRHLGLWSFNPCRVIYLLDEEAPNWRFGFAFGTLAGHSESGEERFTVEMRADESVWYRVHTFARARHPLARLAPWAVRHYQRRFGRESLGAMQRAVAPG